MRSNGNEKMVIFGETVLQQFILQNKHKRILSKKKIYMQFCERIVTSGWFRQGQGCAFCDFLKTRFRDNF